MKKENLVSLGLNDEQIEYVLSRFQNMLPRERYNTVNEAKKNLESELAERDKQLAELKKSADASESLKQKIDELEVANSKTKEDYEKRLLDMKADYVIDSALITAKVKNVKAARALLNFDSIEFDGETIKGLEDKISKLQESDGYLFETSTINGAKPTFGNDVTEPSKEVGSFGASLAKQALAMRGITQ